MVLTAAQFAQVSVGPVTSSPTQIWAEEAERSGAERSGAEAGSQNSTGAGSSGLTFSDAGSSGTAPIMIADGGSAELGAPAAPGLVHRRERDAAAR